MAFDIQLHDFTKAAEVTHTFNLVLPTGEDSGAKLEVIGSEAPIVKNFIKRIVQEDAIRKAKLERQQAKGIYKEDSVDFEGNEAFIVDNALIRLVGWKDVKENGKNVPFTKEKAKEVLKQHLWICTQITAESNEIVNFTPKAKLEV